MPSAIAYWNQRQGRPSPVPPDTPDAGSAVAQLAEKVRAATMAGRVNFLPYLDYYTEETDFMRRMYPLMLRNAVVKQALQTKVESVAALDLQVVPASDDKRDHEVADFVRYGLQDAIDGGFPALAREVIYPALITKSSVSELVWRPDLWQRGRWAGKRFLRCLKAKEYAQPVWDEFRNIVAVRAMGFGQAETFPVDDFLVFINFRLYQGAGMSDLRAAYSELWQLDTVEKLRLIHLEKFLSPVLTATYGPQTNAGELALLDADLAAVRSRNWIRTPEHIKVASLQLAVRGEAEFTDFVRDKREMVAVSIAGAYLQMMTAISGGDIRGNARTQQSTSELLVWALAGSLVSGVNTVAVPRLVQENYAGADYPKATLGAINYADMLQAMQIDRQAQEAGAPLSKRAFARKYGLQLADPSDPQDVLQPAQPQGPQGGANPPQVRGNTLMLADPDDPRSFDQAPAAPPRAGANDVALAGPDGAKATQLLRHAEAEGARVLASVAGRAVARLIGYGRRATRARRLFTDAERRTLADALAATNATAHLLGQARIRRRADQAEKNARAFCGGPGSGVPGPCPEGGADAPFTPHIISYPNGYSEEFYSPSGEHYVVMATRRESRDWLGRKSSSWEVIFGAHDEKGNLSPKATGREGSAAVGVLRAVGSAVDRFVKAKSPEAFTFSAARSERSRVRLYDRAAQVIAQRNAYSLQRSGGLTKITYRFTRNAAATTVQNERSFAEDYDAARRFSDSPTDLRCFDETGPLVPMAPARALEYFRSLVPGITGDPAHFAETQEREAFTLAVTTDETLLRKVQDLIGERLESGQSIREAAGEIDDLLDAAGVTSDNPQYCFLPGTVVEGAVIAASKAWYDGPAVEIETDDGRRLSVTVNHPVLTAAGWKSAGEVKQGDDLVCYGRPVEPLDASLRPRGSHILLPRVWQAAVGSSPGRRTVHNKYAPSRIEDVFEAIRAERLSANHIERPGAPLDFYGDAAFFDGEVHCVWANRKLMGNVNADRGKLAQQINLMLGNIPAAGSSRERAGLLGQARFRTSHAPLALRERPQYPVPLAGRQGRPMPSHFIGAAANLDPDLFEATDKRPGGDVELGGKLIQRLPGVVATHCVVDIKRVWWTGHVYDLHTSTGFIVSQGIVTSNCEMVFRTNMMDAYAVGSQRELAEVADVFPAWRYHNPSDRRSRPEHAARDGKYYPSSRNFTDVRGTDAADVCNCRCVMIPVDRFEWSELKAGGAAFEED